MEVEASQELMCLRLSLHFPFGIEKLLLQICLPARVGKIL